MFDASYEQATGRFTIHTPAPIVFHGYAGRGPGRDNPALQHVKNVGPPPRGVYRLGLPFLSDTCGPVCFRLTPDGGQQMFGRSGFLIHGDNRAHDASHGCIILDRSARDAIARIGVRRLFVTRGDPVVQSEKFAA